MKSQAKPPVWKMVKEAVEALGGTTTNIAVRDWILKKYPGTNPTTIGLVKRHIAKGKPVRGLIIAQHISERIRYALADVPNITAREYKLHLTLADVPHVDEAEAKS
jgi:hypothetical protein